jgi:hypothetical protein
MTATAAAKPPNSKFPRAIFIRCPPALPTAVARAADRRMTNVSAYVRGTVLERLQRDEINLVETEAVVTQPSCSSIDEAPA